jgi:acyl-CoA thioesterase FadM
MYKKTFEHTVTVSPLHIDNLNHVNNVVYLQWVQDVARPIGIRWPLQRCKRNTPG